MKKRTQGILLIILGLLLIAILLNQGQSEPGANSGTTDQDKTSGPRDADHGAGSPATLLGGQTSAQTDPKHPGREFGSTVNVNIKAGETLVMGGYRREDGMHEFTLLTPTLVTLEDGSERIKLSSKVTALNLESAQNNGLNTLTTQYPTADNHAEAWTQEEVRSTLLNTSKDTSAGFMAAPSIIGIPGELFTMDLGGANGISNYTLEATISNHAEGGFSIQSRVERKSGE